MENWLPWYVAGPLIGLSVPLLLFLKGKALGMSSGLRWLAHLLPLKLSYLQQETKKDQWQFEVALGLIVVGFVSGIFDFLPSNQDPDIFQFANIVPLFIGSILVGFGARMAGGCTAGHCIMGNAQFSPSSLLATIGFFVGGLFSSHVIIDQVLNWK